MANQSKENMFKLSLLSLLTTEKTHISYIKEKQKIPKPAHLKNLYKQKKMKRKLKKQICNNQCGS